MSTLRIWSPGLVLLLAIALAGCARNDDARTNSPAHEAGKAAYKVAQDTRQAVKKADRKLREAGREAREGWNDAKREAQAKKDKDNQ